MTHHAPIKLQSHAMIAIIMFTISSTTIMHCAQPKQALIPTTEERITDAARRKCAALKRAAYLSSKLEKLNEQRKRLDEQETNTIKQFVIEKTVEDEANNRLNRIAAKAHSKMQNHDGNKRHLKRLYSSARNAAASVTEAKLREISTKLGQSLLNDTDEDEESDNTANSTTPAATTSSSDSSASVSSATALAPAATSVTTITTPPTNTPSDASDAPTLPAINAQMERFREIQQNVRADAAILLELSAQVAAFTAPPTSNNTQTPTQSSSNNPTPPAEQPSGLGGDDVVVVTPEPASPSTVPAATTTPSASEPSTEVGPPTLTWLGLAASWIGLASAPKS